MMSISIENSLMTKRTLRASDAVEANKRLWTIGIGFFFSLGIMAMIFGLLLAAESYVGLVIRSDRVANLSALLLITSFPLLILGAHSMDKVAAIELEQREASSTIDKRNI